MANIDESLIAVPLDLEGAGAYLNAQAQQMADELAKLWSQLEPLSIWTGKAKTYYEGLQQEWNTAAAGLFAPDGVLGQIANAMHTTWGNYSEAEASNARTWQHT
jgi:uncharacterized protein YukE